MLNKCCRHLKTLDTHDTHWPLMIIGHCFWHFTKKKTTKTTTIIKKKPDKKKQTKGLLEGRTKCHFNTCKQIVRYHSTCISESKGCSPKAGVAALVLGLLCRDSLVKECRDVNGRNCLSGEGMSVLRGGLSSTIGVYMLTIRIYYIVLIKNSPAPYVNFFNFFNASTS